MDYDALGRPTILWGNEVVAFAGMGYYAHGGPAGRSLANGATSEWGFDAIQRVTALVQNAAGTSADLFLSLSYNPASQIASRTLDNDAYAWTGHYAVNRPYTTNGLNQYIAAGGPAMSYDANGNLISDGANNNYTYDIENRLVSASGAHNATLAYDPLGRLSQLTAAGITTTFLYDGDALVAEYEGATLRRRYAHWAGADVPLLSFTDSDFNSPNYLHADQQGSIVMVSGAGTPIINRYDEYGIPQSTNTGRFQYTGQAYLAELGLYYYKARIYSPTLGRFLQTDPIGYQGGINLYNYVGNDPVDHSDPAGTCTENTCPVSAFWGSTEYNLSVRQTEERAAAITVPIFVAIVASPLAIPLMDGYAVMLGRVGFMATRSALSAAERTSASGLTRPMNSAINTIRNIMRNNATVGDFVGAARESRGISTGFDHVTEMGNSMRGLSSALRSIAGSLRNPNLAPEVRASLQAWRRAAEVTLRQMRRVLG
jgi:RHS repeat-associated protein